MYHFISFSVFYSVGWEHPRRCIRHVRQHVVHYERMSVGHSQIHPPQQLVLWACRKFFIGGRCSVKFLLISCSFHGKFGHTIGWSIPPLGMVPPSGKIWTHNCNFTLNHWYNKYLKFCLYIALKKHWEYTIKIMSQKSESQWHQNSRIHCRS